MHPKLAEFLKNHYYTVIRANRMESVEIYNPYTPENLFVQSEKEGCWLRFAGWENFYANSEEGMDDILQDMDRIFNNDAYIWKVRSSGSEMIGYVNDEQSTFKELMNGSGELLSLLSSMYSVDPATVSQSFIYWNPKEMDPRPSLFLS